MVEMKGRYIEIGLNIIILKHLIFWYLVTYLLTQFKKVIIIIDTIDINFSFWAGLWIDESVRESGYFYST